MFPFYALKVVKPDGLILALDPSGKEPQIMTVVLTGY